MSEISQYTESLHEECGVFGMYDKTGGTDMVSAVYSALYALQHRGQESCGIALNVDGVLSGYRDLGLVSEVFTKRVLEELPRGAKMATGHVRYATAGQRSRSNAQPMVLHHCKGAMAVCHNGNLVNAPKLRRKLEMSGSIFHGTSDTEVIAYLLTQNRLLTPNIEMAVSRTMDDIEGAYSLVIMTHTKLIAARDPNGFRPLCIGELPDGNGYAFASESCALDAAGATLLRDVEPGEIVIADTKTGELRSIKDHCGRKDTQMCVFEYIYFSRPDSIIEGCSVHEARKQAGRFLAQEHPVEADVVIGVGTRYTDFTTASKWLFKDTCKFVNINVSEFQSLKMEAVPVVADAKEALPRLEKLLEGYQTAYKDEVKVAKEKWIDELNRLDHITFSDKKSWKPEINDANADSAKHFAQDVNAQLTQTSALGAINAMMSEGDVAIGAAGSLPGDMQRMWRPTGVDTYNMEYGYSTMGYEVAGALGVKLAIGDKHEVYSFCGDGSFNMLHGELITACQEHKKINICLFDNASFGCINNLQVGHGNVTLCTELRYRNKDGLFGNFMNIDYAKVAEAYGCKSYSVRTMEELVAAFEDAKKVKNIPVLFDIKVLPKTMTDGYSSWWRVGDTEVSERKENLAAYADLQAHLKEVRKY